MNASRSQPEQAPEARQRLLAVAREAFARQGFDGASIRTITGVAEVNLGAVTYHFGSKERLYHAVLEELFGPLRVRIRFASQASVPPLGRIEEIVRAFFTHVRAHPQMPAIMVREMASGGEIAPPVRQMMGEVIPLVAGIIRSGQNDATIREGDPLLMTLSTFAQPVYLYLARHALAQVAGLDLEDPESFERVVDHAVRTIRRALENR
jgi:AcrR family transcriptional regulator